MNVESPEPSLLFVYGSLRRGSGHAMSLWLSGRADWRGPARLRGRLYRVSWYPGVVAGEGEVLGDLYRLHDAAMALPELDAFEDIRHEVGDEYRRDLAAVELEGAEQLAWVYWYLKPVSEEGRVVSGDWLKQ